MCVCVRERDEVSGCVKGRARAREEERARERERELMTQFQAGWNTPVTVFDVCSLARLFVLSLALHC